MEESRTLFLPTFGMFFYPKRNEPKRDVIGSRIDHGIICALYDCKDHAIISFEGVVPELLITAAESYKSLGYNVEVTGTTLRIGWGDTTLSDTANLISSIEREIKKEQSHGRKSLRFIMENFYDSKKDVHRQESKEVIEKFTRDGYYIKWARMEDFCCGMDLCQDGWHLGYFITWD